MARLTLLIGIVLISLPSAAAQDTAATPGAGAGQKDRLLRVKPRYYRWHVDPGVEWIEKNTGYAELDWQIPLSQAALVLVDVWDRHYIKDPEERAEKIIQERIRPLLAVCRRAGLQIIHAPSPSQARANPAWVGARQAKALPGGKIRKAAAGGEQVWPPRAFRGKSGPYKKYARPLEPRAKDRAEMLKGLAMHPDVQAEGSEVVVANGEELHQYCKQKGIMFLFYLGFNTNACVLLRDYGTIEMSKRGYEILIVRDCTTGMESFETHDELWQTRGAILFLEMFGKYSVSSEQLIAGLPK